MILNIIIQRSPKLFFVRRSQTLSFLLQISFEITF